MTNLIDTHAHIYLKEFIHDAGEIIHESKKAGVSKIYMPNIDSSSVERMLALEEKYPGYCHAMMGLHPCYVKENYKEELAKIKSRLSDRSYCAIGEIGIDLYWDKSFKKQQTEVFELQINWAKELNIPIVIHCRASVDLTIEIVKKHQDGNLNGIFHCFSGSIDQAEKIIDLNFLLGIGGVVTFKNGGLDKIIHKINLDNIVLETDSPYLAPVPYRGKRNKPVYLKEIALKTAELKSCTVEEVSEITTKNALNIFGNGR
jgi:TatD DNase family protein